MKRLYAIVVCLCMSFMAWAEQVEVVATQTATGCTLGISVSADQKYTGFQMDVVTEGAYTFFSAAPAPEFGLYSFSAQPLASGNVRILAYTDAADAFIQGTSQLFIMDFRGEGEAEFRLRNIRFTKADGTEVVIPNASATLTVAPPPTYKLTFYLDGEIFSSSDMLEGEAVQLPDVPEREGYTFGGWLDVPETMPAYDVDIYGEYNVNYYSLTFIIDGVELSSEQVPYGSEVVAPDVPEKPGLTFAGWDDLPPTMPAHDVTVTGTYQVASGVAGVCNIGRSSDRALYTLSGLRVRESHGMHGVFIEDGKKVLLGK